MKEPRITDPRERGKLGSRQGASDPVEVWEDTLRWSRFLWILCGGLQSLITSARLKLWPFAIGRRCCIRTWDALD